MEHNKDWRSHRVGTLPKLGEIKLVKQGEGVFFTEQ